MRNPGPVFVLNHHEAATGWAKKGDHRKITEKSWRSFLLLVRVYAWAPERPSNSSRSRESPFSLTKVSQVVPGGRRRQDSVRLGIEASKGLYSTVLIHDGVRPFIEHSLISKVVSAAGRHRAVIAAMPARETVKEVDESGLVVKTHDRRWVWSVQTPQVFRYKDIHRAHQKAVEEGWEDLTDDALLMEKMGIVVKVIEGSEQNIKITTPKDLELAEYILQMRSKE
jgi:2-C-methyl-D-erythritol 4-phosphate cytidylyltransferase